MVDLRLRLSRRAFAMTALATPAMAGLLAACGGDDDDAPSTGGQTTSTQAPSGGEATTATSATTEQTSGGVAPEDQTPVVIVQGGDPVTLDPQFAESVELANLLFTMFDSLIAYNLEMEIVGEAAETWELLEDEKTWQFKLREGMTFWNGEPLDANAVKFTFDRMLDEKLRDQGLNDLFPGRVGLDRAEVVDDLTVNIITKEPSVNFPVYVTFVSILAPQYYTDTPTTETAIKPMGSGPWMFEEWVKDDHITMKANPDYHLGRPPIETVIFKPVAEGATRMAMLETGEADIIVDASPEDIKRMEGVDGYHSCVTNDGRRIHIELPTEHELFSDRRVRQALNYAVNFDAINEAILGGLATGRMAVPLNGDWWIDPSIEPYPYDPDKAKQLLEEAGWDPDTEVTIYASIGRYIKGVELAQAVAGEWQKVGIKATVQPLENTVFNDRARKSEFDMPWLAGWGSRFWGPDDLGVLFEDGYQGFEWREETEGGPEAFELMKELSTTFDRDRQQELAYQISRIFVEEAPWVFLWKQAGLFGVSDRIDWMCGGKARAELWFAGEEPTRFTT